ncbi:MAG: MCE family protein [Haloechinothrix sp.]
MSTHRKALLSRLRHQALGLVFLIVVVLFFAVTIGTYNKAFTDVALVQLKVGHAGNQMREGADVKVRGMVVGEVRSITTSGDGATLALALNPARLEVIPANVSAQLLPKTLFGERYVKLSLPEGQGVGAVAHIQAGAVIPQDRSRNAIELERALDNLMPVLQAVEPQKLASALNAVSTALDGRGEKLGETLVEFSEFVGEFNPSLPDLKADLSAFAEVADTYAEASPDLLDAMSTFTTTSKTLVEQQHNLIELYSTVTAASVDLTGFFRVNKDNLINLTTNAQPTLDVLAKYAPQYPCMLRQLAAQVPAAEKAFGLGTAHPETNAVTIEFISGRGAYEPGVDEPRYLDKRGPRCYQPAPYPQRWPQYPPDGAIKDGSSHPPTGEDDGTADIDYEDFGSPSGSGGAAAGVPVANSPMEQQLLSVLSAPSVGHDPANVPGWSSLLVGPLYRGMEVRLR